ncbi:formylglycine-generating enzyme family protein [Marivirga sp. S37H4]|uniref:Formylglycine-generating enzyme family protein n=1 Tax=Marivirga aurantiaca TaxID=2802615 RepID=A0A934WW26_9BACT|nr:formylglycine-generating enzyme family protein [Marivirga aurantiaca]MBK6263991.1 formylglycine-generating enzyme family protein [Marivirga aurantiaca]
MLRYFKIFLFFVIVPFNIWAQEVEMQLVSGGIYTPLYGSTEESQVEIPGFFMDAKPVTHEQFQLFVLQYPEWRKSNVRRLYADESYLNSWKGDFGVPRQLKNSPVNNVSWYAAKAYCECQDKRLPTTDEWEFVAMASEKSVDAREDSLFNQRIVSSYEKPKTFLKEVGKTTPNYYGIYDLHGLVWEWVYDFNSIIITEESRSNNSTDNNLFCAGGAVSANDLMNYAAFMRYAIRSSVKARNTMSNMGFRCVKDDTKVLSSKLIY